MQNLEDIYVSLCIQSSNQSLVLTDICQYKQANSLVVQQSLCMFLIYSNVNTYDPPCASFFLEC